jgi:hypothetical protein
MPLLKTTRPFFFYTTVPGLTKRALLSSPSESPLTVLKSFALPIFETWAEFSAPKV